jgi:hypothetical protein
MGTDCHKNSQKDIQSSKAPAGAVHGAWKHSKSQAPEKALGSNVEPVRHSGQNWFFAVFSGTAISQPGGRKRIAQQFIAGSSVRLARKSREGRKTCVHGGFLPSLPGLSGMDVRNPSDESLGYCLASLWDYVSRPSSSST